MEKTTTPEKVQYIPVHNAEVKAFKQTIVDEETGLAVKHLYYIKILRGNITMQINVGEKTYTQLKTLTDEKAKTELQGKVVK